MCIKKPSSLSEWEGSVPENSLEGRILDKYGLSPKDVESMSTTRTGELTLVTIQLSAAYPACPSCAHPHPHVYNYSPKKINMDLIAGDKCFLIYRQRRYRCPQCGRSYLETSPFTFKKQRIAKEKVLDILNCLKSPTETFSSAARRFNVSPTTVQNLFDQFVCVATHRSLPEVLLIDEVHAFHSEFSEYVCMFLDGRTLEPVDLLPTRRKADLLDYFRQYPPEEREKVRYFSSDMYKVYQEAARVLFPNAVIAIDRFHVAQLFSRQAQKVRIRIMNGQSGPERRKNYSLLKNHNNLLTVSRNTRVEAMEGSSVRYVKIFDPMAARKYSPILQRKVNSAGLLQAILEIHPDLVTTRKLADQFEELFKRYKSPKEAARPLHRLIQALKASGITELISVGETMDSYRQQILNSFTTTEEYWVVDPKDGSADKYEKKLTSSLIENKNRIVKIIKNNANGYRNWKRFRNRVLWCLIKDLPLRG